MIRELGRPGDLGWVVQAHGELYPAEYGWNTTLETMVARIMADYGTGHDPARKPARALCPSRGFRLIDEQPYASFGPALVGQTYRLEF